MGNNTTPDFELNTQNTTIDYVNGNGSLEVTLSFDVTIRRHVGWAFLFIFLVSTFGNMVIIIVMNKSRNKELVTSTFFTALAVSDLLHGAQVSLTKFFLIVLNWRVVTPSTPPEWGVIRMATTFSNTQISTWILVAVTVERVLCVLLPHRVKYLCTKLNAKIWVVAICVSCLGLNTTMMFVMLDVVAVDQGRLVFLPKFPNARKIFFLYEFINGFMLPFLVICFGSVYIVIDLYRRSGNKSALGRVNSATKMIVLANLAFIITISPMRLYNIITYTRMSPYTQILDLIKYISFVFVDSNSAVNFFVYCLGSPRFRQDVKKLFCRRSRPTETISVITFANIP